MEAKESVSNKYRKCCRISSSETLNKFHRKDWYKTTGSAWLIVLLLGWVFDFLFWKEFIRVNFALFSVVCLLGGMGLLFVEGYRPARNSLWLLFLFAFFVVITFLRQEPLTIFLAYALTALSVGLLANTYLGGRWFQYSLIDYLSKLIRLVAGVIYLPMRFFAQARDN